MSKIEVNQISSQCGSTLTIGQSGDTVTLAAGATQSGFGRTGTVDWDTTAKTVGFTAVSGTGYFVNTTSGAITVTLPTSPSAGDIVSLSDYASTWDTNNVTIASALINGSTGSPILSTKGQAITFIYVDGTRGWKAVQDNTQNISGALYVTATGGTVTCCGDYKIHTFTGPGTFTVTCAGNAGGSTTVDYLVVAGGGGGGSRAVCVGAGASGGGGAGGYRSNYPSGCAGVPVSTTSYPITVGGGGSAGPVGTPKATGTNGNNSIFSTITSAGGGAGSNAGGPIGQSGNSGGSGGGGGASCTGGPGGAGNTPPVAPPQGQNGGTGAPGGYGGGSGGGASVAGSNASASPGGVGGGNGTANLINPATGEPSGCTQYYAGGGGGGNWCSPAIPAGGLGGGGNGAGQPAPTVVAAQAGTANTGGGGGGSFGTTPGAGGAGGSGIVIIRYKFQN